MTCTLRSTARSPVRFAVRSASRRRARPASPTSLAAGVVVLVVAAASACADKAGGTDKPDDATPRLALARDVRIAPEALARNGIRTETVKADVLGGGTEVPAEVEPHPDRIARVGVLVPGRVKQVLVVVGAKVKRGQPLCVVESAELSGAQSDVSQAQATLDAARATWQRQQELQAAGVGAKKEALEAQANLRRAEAALAAALGKVQAYGGVHGGGATTLKSPLDGEVLERHATIGETVAPDDTLFVVGDISVVWVTGRLSEQDVSAAKAGAAAELTLAAYPGRTFQGTLSCVAPMLDERTRTLSVRMELDNEDGILRPGLFGRLRLVGDTGEAAKRPVVPEAAVQRTPAGDVVFVATQEPGVFAVQPVAVGVRRAGRAEILSGIEPGADVVVDGAFILKSDLLKSQMAADED